MENCQSRMMNELERDIVLSLKEDLLQSISVDYVAPYLYSIHLLDDVQMSSIFEVTFTEYDRRKLCLNCILERCSFTQFIESLRHDKLLIHNSLADELVQRKEDLQEKLKTASEVVQQVDKLPAYRRDQKKLSRFSQRLKTLVHNDNMRDFKTISERIRNKFNESTGQRGDVRHMQYADIMFITINMAIEAMRVKYDESLYKGDIFKKMEALIPHTTNPTASSMTYLVRFGSALTMKEPLEEGLKYIEYSKHHLEQVVPCRETGMVLYIEINLLSQKFEQNPDTKMKENILKRAKLAIFHFGHEEETIKRDYERMIMLKMVFCYLGIGLFGNKLSEVDTREGDLESAKNCLDHIEQPDQWNGMDNRRKMLFHIAKAEYLRLNDQTDLATMHANKALRFAKKYKWNKELPSIKELLDELESLERAKHNEQVPVDELTKEVLDLVEEGEDIGF